MDTIKTKELPLGITESFAIASITDNMETKDFIVKDLLLTLIQDDNNPYLDSENEAVGRVTVAYFGDGYDAPVGDGERYYDVYVLYLDENKSSLAVPVPLFESIFQTFNVPFGGPLEMWHLQCRARKWLPPLPGFSVLVFDQISPLTDSFEGIEYYYYATKRIRCASQEEAQEIFSREVTLLEKRNEDGSVLLFEDGECQKHEYRQGMMRCTYCGEWTTGCHICPYPRSLEQNWYELPETDTSTS